MRIGFLDDLTIGGKLDIITRDVELVKREATLRGLQLNEAKCEIICQNDSSATHNPKFVDQLHGSPWKTHLFHSSFLS